MGNWPALRVAAWVYAGYLLSWQGVGVRGALLAPGRLWAIAASAIGVQSGSRRGLMLVAGLSLVALVLFVCRGLRRCRLLQKGGRALRIFWAPFLALAAGVVHSPAWEAGPAALPEPARRSVCVWITGGGGERAEGVDAHTGLRLRLRAGSGLCLPPPGSLLRVTGVYRPPGRLRYLERGLRPVGAAARVAARHRPGSLRVRSIDDSICSRPHAPPAGLAARAWVSSALLRTADASGLFRALLLADRSGLDPRFTQEMRAAGLAHILALSGLHIGFVAMVIVTLTARLPRSLGAVTLALALAGVPLVVGPSPSVLRASSAAIAWALGRGSGRRVATFNAVGVGALLIWILDSSAPCEAGFQLSFAATAAILLAVRPVRCSGFWRRVAAWLWEGVWIGIAAQLGTFGLVAHHFGRLPLWAPLNGLPAVPLAAALLAALLCGLPIAWLGGAGLGSGVEHAGGWAAWGIAMVAHYAARLPGAVLSMPPLSMGAALAVTALGLALTAALAAGQWRRAAAAVFSLFLVLAPPFWRNWHAPRHFVVMVADVGQGLAVWMRWPDHRTLLFDTGPPAFHGDPPLRRALACTGADDAPAKLETAVVSHAHADHDGAIGWVIDACHPNAVVYPVIDHASRRTENALENAGVSVPRGLALGAVERDSSWIAVRAVPRLPVSTNDSSIALVASAWGHQVLVPGDLEKAGEAALVEVASQWEDEILRSDVLVLGHHGSRTSSSAPFLDLVRPRVAIASAGLQNSFGHPHEETVVMLRERGIPLLRTDRDGTILLETDGSEWWCATASGRGWRGRLGELPRRRRWLP